MSLLQTGHPAPVSPSDNSERHINATWLFATLVFVASLGFYVATMCRTVFWWDSGELVANAHVLGIAHRPGFPLYILAARVFGLIPFGEYFYRVNFISAASAAVSLGALGYIVSRLLQRLAKPLSLKESILPAALGILGIAGTYSFWIQAVRAEVYAPNLLLVILLVGCAWRADTDLGQGLRTGGRWLCAAGFLAGLGMTMHNATFASAIPAVVVFLLYLGRRHRIPLQTWLAAGLLAIVGLSVYLYLPIRGGQNPALNWGWVSGVGSPDWSGVAATDSYHYIADTSMADLMVKFREIGRMIFDQLQWGLVLLAGLGLAQWWFLGRRWLLLVVGIILGNVFVTALLVTDFSTTNADIHGYLLPAIAGISFLVSGGVLAFWRMLERIGRRFLPTPAARYVLNSAVLTMLVLLVVTPFLVYGPFCDLSENYLAYSFGTESIAELNTGAVVFVAGTNWDFVLRGLQYADGWRPDIMVLNRDLMPSSWYRHWMFNKRPQLAATEIPTDSAGLRLFEWGVELAKTGIPVYWEFTERDLRSTSHFVPAGHLFELTAEPVDVLDSQLLDEQEAFEHESRFYASTERILLDQDAQMVWVTNLYRAGMYYESRGLLGRAKALYKRALSVSPSEDKLIMASQRVSPHRGILVPPLRQMQATVPVGGAALAVESP